MTVREFNNEVAALKINKDDLFFKTVKDVTERAYFRLRIIEECAKTNPDWGLVAKLAILGKLTHK